MRGHVRLRRRGQVRQRRMSRQGLLSSLRMRPDLQQWAVHLGRMRRGPRPVRVQLLWLRRNVLRWTVHTRALLSRRVWTTVLRERAATDPLPRVNVLSTEPAAS
jgi:hypothetical protein